MVGDIPEPQAAWPQAAYFLTDGPADAPLTCFPFTTGCCLSQSDRFSSLQKQNQETNNN